MPTREDPRKNSRRPNNNNRRRPMTQEEREKVAKKMFEEKMDAWVPKTEIGRLVKSGEITDIDEIFATGKPILESEIIDTLFPEAKSELLPLHK